MTAWTEPNGNVRMIYFGRPLVEKFDALPCPKCQSTDLDFFASVVECFDCDYLGPAQKGPEYMCDWRTAIEDWNNAPLRNLAEPWQIVTTFQPVDAAPTNEKGKKP